MKDGNDDQSSNPRNNKGGDDSAEERSVTSRKRARHRLSEDVEQFLASGGAIREIDPDVTADPPRKPQPKYGSRPI
ncbi:hypothetical protein [Microbulbifer sp. 2201CG32-9]|uniref:hypothetical protein n=1 Tax=unclassified Microbulbifer TaxID=2619833 RepID=UPI00345B6253